MSDTKNHPYEVALDDISRSVHSIWREGETYDGTDEHGRAITRGLVHRILRGTERAPTLEQGDRYKWIGFHDSVLAASRRYPAFVVAKP